MAASKTPLPKKDGNVSCMEGHRNCDLTYFSFQEYIAEIAFTGIICQPLAFVQPTIIGQRCFQWGLYFPEPLIQFMSMIQRLENCYRFLWGQWETREVGIAVVSEFGADLHTKMPNTAFTSINESQFARITSPFLALWCANGQHRDLCWFRSK